MEVSIAGCGAVTAAGHGIPALLDALRANRSALQACERFTGAAFQTNILGGIPGGVDGDNPAFELANLALSEARAEASNSLKDIPADRIGLILSTTKANIEALERILDERPCSDVAKRHRQADHLAADLAQQHGARGPVQTLSVACISGLIALQQGAKLIQRGAADAMLIVGVDCLSPFVVAGFTALKALDVTGCRPFDRDRSGLSPGEAGSAIVLVRGQAGASHLIGWGGSNDANHLTGPSRDGSGLALAMQRALGTAQVAPSDIHYVNAHGTGTPYNDAMESLALQTIFGKESPPVSASKGIFGHTLGAAGILESIVCILAAREKFLPGTPRLTTPADGAPSQLLQKPSSTNRHRHSLKLGTGFGGVNGALVFRHE